jgi:oligosaccharide repeat unit polymerase
MTDLLSIVVASAAALVALALFYAGWRVDSKGRLVFSAFLIFAANEIMRNWGAAASAPWRGIGTGFATLHYMLFAFALFVVGFYATTRVLGHRSIDATIFHEAPPLPVPPAQAAAVVAIVSLILFGLGVYLYQGLPPVLSGLFALARGDDGALVALYVSASREELTKGYLFGGEYRGQGALRIVMEWGWPILTAVAGLMYKERRTVRWLVVSLLLLFCAFVFIAGTGSRGPFVWSLVYLVLVFSLVVRIRWYFVAIGFAGMVALLIALSAYSGKLYFVLQGEGGFRVALASIFERIFLGNGHNTTVVVDLIESGQWAMRDGEIHSRNFLNALPGVTVGGLPLAYELYLWLNPGGRATTYLSTTYYAELFLDFGWFGAGLAYLLFGVLIAVVQQAILTRRWSALTLPFVAGVLLVLGRIPNVGVTGVMATAVVLIALLALVQLSARGASIARMFRSIPKDSLVRP